MSAVLPGMNQGMSCTSGFLPEHDFDEVMIASGSKQLSPLLTLTRKNSQDSFRRLSDILTDRKTVNSPKECISEFKKNAVLSDYSSNKKWLSSGDRELSYALVISEKIR